MPAYFARFGRWQEFRLKPTLVQSRAVAGGQGVPQSQHAHCGRFDGAAARCGCSHRWVWMFVIAHCHNRLAQYTEGSCAAKAYAAAAAAASTANVESAYSLGSWVTAAVDGAVGGCGGHQTTWHTQTADVAA